MLLKSRFRGMGLISVMGAENRDTMAHRERRFKLENSFLCQALYLKISLVLSCYRGLAYIVRPERNFKFSVEH